MKESNLGLVVVVLAAVQGGAYLILRRIRLRNRAAARALLVPVIVALLCVWTVLTIVGLASAS